MLEEQGAKKILTAIDDHIRNRVTVPTGVLTEFLSLNGVDKPGKLKREEVEELTLDFLEHVDYRVNLPQDITLTGNMLTKVLDPLLMVRVPTGRYRVTMRKLLRLSLSQLQEQASLMQVPIEDMSEELLALNILRNMTEDTPLIEPLIKILLLKEIAYVYGIRFSIPTRGPSTEIIFTVRPSDIDQSTLLSRDDVFEECENQGITLRNGDKLHLANKLVAYWILYPKRLRQPFTRNFASFLMEMLSNNVDRV